MLTFLQALDRYRTGNLSDEQLIGEIQRQIDRRTLNVTSAWAELEVAHSRVALPEGLHSELVRLLRRRRLSAVLEDATREASERASATDPTRPIADVDSLPTAPERRIATLALGTVLRARFRLVERIGDGGMSTVFKAVDLRKIEARTADTNVAVKILAVPAGDFAESLQTLQAEALTLQRLPHPNIVRVIDCDRDGAIVFMTMEYLTGESLKRKMMARSFKALPAADATAIIEKTAAGLAFAHHNGVVHGDLKPGNIHLTDEGGVKIIDFGISRLITRDPGGASAGDERPQPSALTPPYASPEMLERGGADARDDIYALACIAHEVLTGHHPFDRRIATEARDSGQKLARSKLLTPSQYRAIAHGLEFDLTQRTPTVEMFLAEFTNGPGLRSRSVRLIAGALVIFAALAAIFLGREQILQWVNAHRTIAAPAPAANGLFRDCPTCPLMKVLLPGHFAQGSAADASDSSALERPQHPVVIPMPVGMSVYEVTVGEFREFASGRTWTAGCMAYDGAWRLDPALNWDHPGFAQSAAHPAVCVSWEDASGYTKWLTARSGHTYRLPSESEWEYAARAGSAGARPWTGAEAACANANIADQTAAKRFPGWTAEQCSDGYVYTAPVGSFKPNASGFYDMLGNAMEWVQDCWHPDYDGAPANGSAWIAPGCSEHVLRGGSWFTSPALVSSSSRSRFETTYRSNSIGFRVVREMAP